MDKKKIDEIKENKIKQNEAKENKLNQANIKESQQNKIKESKIIKQSKLEQYKIKLTNLCNKILNSSFFTIIIISLIVLKALLFYKNTIMIREGIDQTTILGTVCFAFILLSFLNIFPNKQRTILTIILDILISIILFADNIYYTYSSNVLSVLQITNLQYGEEILGTIPVLLNLTHLLYFIDIIIILILLSTKKLQIQEKKENLKKTVISKLYILALGFCIFISVGKECISATLQDPYNKDTQIRKGSIFGYHIADIMNAVNTKKQAKYDTKDKMMEDYLSLKAEYEQYEVPRYNFENMCEGKNLIILQLESVQDFVINKKINGKEITPNLNKFLNENIRFTNMFMQSYSSTADSEFSSITSLYPMENGMSYSKYDSNKYDDIFTSFKEADYANYTTSYVHGNYGYFWNRENVYKNFGVDKIEFKDSFEDISEDIMGYLSDELLYKQTVEKLENYQKPFMTYIVSASSHTGFTLDGLQDETKVSIDVGKYSGTFFGNYLRSVNYADYAFGLFIDELKASGLYDDSVILIFGDHNGIDMYNGEMLEFLKQTNPDMNDAEIKLNYIRVACGMKLPGIQNLKIEKPVSKLDVKPTICYLFGLDSKFSLGTNMFAGKDFISLNNKRIVTSRYYFDEKWYKIDDGKELVYIDDGENVEDGEDAENIENTEEPENEAGLIKMQNAKEQTGEDEAGLIKVENTKELEDENIAYIDKDTYELLNKYYSQMEREIEISNSVSINNLLK